MDSGLLSVTATDGMSLAVHRWLPDAPNQPKAVVQIAHGLAEHAARYERFAAHLVDAGYAVYAQDHRGHGKTAGTLEEAGYFADSNGWATVVKDLSTVTERIKTDHPGLPVFLLGHSMGSLLSRSYAIAHGEQIAGLVLSGTAGDPGVLGKVGRIAAWTQAKLQGRHKASPLLDKLTFGPYNAAFKPNRTDFDWISRDPAEVDAYVADPWCGWVASAGLYGDLLDGLAMVNSDAAVDRVRKDLPIYVFSGEVDPVGGLKGVTQVADQYRRLGVTDVTSHLYPGGRHEMLNETNRDEVFADVVEWLDSHLPA